MLQLGADEPRRDHDPAAVHITKGLPEIGVVDAGRAKGNADVHWIVDRHIARVVGAGNARDTTSHVAALVGSITVSEVEHGLCGDVADPGRGGDISGEVSAVVAEIPHQRIEDGRDAPWK